MQGSFKETLTALSDSPAVAKASGISEERTLIIDMIEAMLASPDALDGFHAADTAEHIIACIRAELHRKDFDA